MQIYFDEEIFSCVHEFTNPDNNIRNLSEQKFFQIKNQYPFQTIHSLLNIIISNPNAIESKSSIICVQQIISKMLINDVEKLWEITVKVVQIFELDNLDRILISTASTILMRFYVMLIYYDKEKTLLILNCFGNALSKKEKKHESIRFFGDLYSRLSPDLGVLHEVSKFISLDEEDEEIRTASFMFYLNMIDLNLLEIQIPNIPLVLNSFTNSHCFFKSLDLVENTLNNSNQNKFPLNFFREILEMLLEKSVDERMDESYRINCMYFFSDFLFTNKICVNILLENPEYYFSFILHSMESPIKYPGLYKQADLVI